MLDFNTRKEGTAIPHRPMLHIGRCTLAVTMDLTERKITKIAREASKLAVRTLKEDGIGTAEYDFVNNPYFNEMRFKVNSSSVDITPPPAVRPVWRPRAT